MSSSKVHVAAVDLGATSGRVIVGSFNAEGLDLNEVHRFPNALRKLNGFAYWDVGHLCHEVVEGLKKAKSLYPELRACGVDTWGVDHALLNKEGRLVFPVHSYRDERTRNLVDRIIQKGEDRQLYDWTGMPMVPFNTTFQLAETLEGVPAMREVIERVLHLPDYFNFLLCGEMVNELSNVATGQLVQAHGIEYSQEVFEYFQFPRHWFDTPQLAGKTLGNIKGVPELADVQVALVAGHDTSCAFEAIPPIGSDMIVSTGTWMLPGALSDKPVTGDKAFKTGFAGERTGRGQYRPNRQMLGLWLLEQILPAFNKRPTNDAEWEALVDAAQALPQSRVRIDLNDKSLFNPDNMKEAIERQLAQNGGKAPDTLEEYMRLICDSLGQGIADAVSDFSEVTGQTYDHVIFVGGGSKNRLLCQRAADCSGLTVTSYKLEGTAVGNIGYQLLALGEIHAMSEFHEVVAKNIEKRAYHPKGSS